MSSYIRLERHSDWGHEYLSLPGQGLSSFGTASASKYGLRFRQGMRIRVRWPNNDQTEEVISTRTVQTTVDDMGHSYPVTYQEPGVRSDFRGTSHWTPLHELDVLDEDVAVLAPASREEP